MNTKFTKGPWTLDKYGAVVDQSKQCIRVKGVALACYQNGEVDANTDLIAAAPDLYEVVAAFERAKDLWLPPDNIDQEHYGEAEALHKIRRDLLSALAKARGEA